MDKLVTLFEKLRLPLSRLIAASILFSIFTTDSLWARHDPVIGALLLFFGIVLASIGAFGRMWCSLFIGGYKNNRLVTAGPYSISRNPLYVFSLIGVTGVGLSTETLFFPGVFLLIFAIYYPFVIKSEEKRLERFFTGDMTRYKKRVPAFFPKFSLYQEPDEYTTRPATYRFHMLNALWFVWLIGIIQLALAMRETGLIPHFWSVY